MNTTALISVSTIPATQTGLRVRRTSLAIIHRPACGRDRNDTLEMSRNIPQESCRGQRDGNPAAAAVWIAACFPLW
jgi:hypothetical protein